MSRRWKVVLVSVVVAAAVAVGVMAAPLSAAPKSSAQGGIGVDIVGIDYNFGATGGDWALRVRWSQHPATEVAAGDFAYQNKEYTLEDIEDRIRHERFDDMLVEDVLWNQLDPEEEPALSGVLSRGEEIVYEPQQKLRVHRRWFAIHIYSLDNPETPESELSFVTRFVKNTVYPGGTTWDEVFPYEWWLN